MFEKFQIVVLSLSLITLLARNAVAQYVPQKELGQVLGERCDKIDPTLISYMNKTGYLKKRINYLRIAIDVYREDNKAFLALKNEANNSALQSRALMGTGLLLLSRGTAMPVLAGTAKATSLNGFIIYGGGVTGLAVTIHSPLAYLETNSEEEFEKAFLKFQSDFDEGHKKLEEIRGKINLNYSPLENAIRLGGAAKAATLQLYEVSMAHTRLYEAELKLLTEVSNRIKQCGLNSIGVNDQGRSSGKEVDNSERAPTIKLRSSKQ